MNATGNYFITRNYRASVTTMHPGETGRASGVQLSVHKLCHTSVQNLCESHYPPHFFRLLKLQECHMKIQMHDFSKSSREKAVRQHMLRLQLCDHSECSTMTLCRGAGSHCFCSNTRNFSPFFENYLMCTYKVMRFTVSFSYIPIFFF